MADSHAPFIDTRFACCERTLKTRNYYIWDCIGGDESSTGLMARPRAPISKRSPGEMVGTGVIIHSSPYMSGSDASSTRLGSSRGWYMSSVDRRSTSNSRYKRRKNAPLMILAQVVRDAPHHDALAENGFGGAIVTQLRCRSVVGSWPVIAHAVTSSEGSRHIETREVYGHKA